MTRFIQHKTCFISDWHPVGGGFLVQFRQTFNTQNRSLDPFQCEWDPDIPSSREDYQQVIKQYLVVRDTFVSKVAKDTGLKILTISLADLLGERGQSC
jgi:hypothetical protein